MARKKTDLSNTENNTSTFKLVTCFTCKTKIPKEQAVYRYKKYYCEKCLSQAVQESQDYKDLIDYICQLYNISAPTPMILSQIKNYKDNMGYTYKGMKTTLDYFYVLKDNVLDDRTHGVGIIPFVYDEAKQFYIERRDSTAHLTPEKIKSILDCNTIIQISQEDEELSQSSSLGMIDISQIGGDFIDEEE